MFGTIITLGCLIYVFWKRGDLLCVPARVKIAKGDINRGLKWMERGYKAGGMSFSNKLSYAFLTFKSGQLDRANMLFNLLKPQCKKPGQLEQVNGSHALVFWKLKDYDTAISMLESVLETAPSTITYGSLGLIYYEKGDMDNAYRVTKAAYEYNKDDMVILDNYATILYEKGDYEEAEEIYKLLHEKKPHFPEAYLGYGKLMIATDRKEEGIAMVKQAFDKKFQFTSTITKEDIQEYLDTVE